MKILLLNAGSHSSPISHRKYHFDGFVGTTEKCLVPKTNFQRPFEL